MAAEDFAGSTGLESLSHLLGLHDISTDARQLAHALGGEPCTPETLVRLAIKVGAQARIANVPFEALASAPLPAIAWTETGRFWVLGAIKAGRALVHRPGHAPEECELGELRSRYAGRLVLLTARSPGTAQKRFDLTWFIPALVKYRGLLKEVLIASLFVQLFALATPLIFQVVIDKVLVHNGVTTLYVLSLALLAIVVFDVLLSGLRAYIFTHTTNRVDVELGAKLYRHVLALPLSYFEARRVGDTVARVRQLETIREFMTSSSVTLVIDLLFTIIFLVVMWFYSPLLWLIVVVAIAAYVGVCILATPILRRQLDERFNRGAESQAFLVESIAGVQTLKAAAVEPQMQARWERLLAGYVGASFRAAKTSIIGGQAIQLVSKISTVAVLFAGAQMVLAGHLTVGGLVAFNMLAGRVAEPVLRLASLWQQFQEARVGLERLGDVLNAPTESAFSASRSALPKIDGEIILDDVTFRYRPAGREVLRRVSLEISPGEVIGIVGPSGSGKSTLTKLVQRFYVPESGRVLIDGVDLSLVDPAWLRRQVGVVLQENLLFNRTLRDNIALADPGLPLEAVIAAARLAGAHEFILELPEGYDTVIEERGANLSGGQRQRIAIARALITNPRILILDEATSALDAESEAIIQANMRAIVRGRTVLIIAHRLTAIRHATRIITVEDGAIIEQGSHEALLARGGRYAQLWRAQANGVGA